MYFLFFKLHSWGKRFGSSRRRFIQRFLSMSLRTSAHTCVVTIGNACGAIRIPTV